MRSTVLALLAASVIAPAALAGPVTLTAADGTTLEAQVWGDGANGVVLVHDAGRSARDWSLFGERLGQKGFHAIAVDLRGHGETGGELAEEDYPETVQDVAAAIGYLRDNGATTIHLVGAGFGANIAIHAAVADPGVADIALLSPGMNLHGVASPSAFETYGDRPALVVVGQDDGYAARSASVLERKSQGPLSVEYLEGDASGVVLINRDPDLEGKLVAWLNGTYDLQGSRQDRAVTAEEAGDVETSGVRFGN